jgi:hypothetical protein
MPSLVELPPELLLSILLDPELDYKDLKRISRVCRGLHKLEQVRSIVVPQDVSGKELTLYYLDSRIPCSTSRCSGKVYRAVRERMEK